MITKDHWDKIYENKSFNEVSWFQEHANLSIRLILNQGVLPSDSIIDVGGGTSTLVDDLLDLGFENTTVLDLSSAALLETKTRLGKRTSRVEWIEANIMEYDLPSLAYDVWHDRAVFHFLINKKDRQKYARKLLRALKPGGLFIIATFDEHGPKECSGLPVMRYTVDTLRSEFGDPFKLLGHEIEKHYTPDGKEQTFLYCLFRKSCLAVAT